MMKWLGTYLCLIGIALTSFNIYPLNLSFGLIGSIIWMAEGYIAKDGALFTVEAAAVAIYLAGVYKVIF